MMPLSDRSSIWSRISVPPTARLVTLLKVMEVVPFGHGPAPVKVAELSGPPLQFPSVAMKQISAFWPQQLEEPVKTRRVLSAPAPRRVTLLFPWVTIDADKLYVPAFRKTTWFAGQEDNAELIWEAVTLCTKVGACPAVPTVAQMVVRVGMPPGTPAVDQSTALVGSIIPLQACAFAFPGISKLHSNNAGKTSNGRTDLMLTSVLC